MVPRPIIETFQPRPVEAGEDVRGNAEGTDHAEPDELYRLGGAADFAGQADGHRIPISRIFAVMPGDLGDDFADGIRCWTSRDRVPDVSR